MINSKIRITVMTIDCPASRAVSSVSFILISSLENVQIRDYLFYRIASNIVFVIRIKVLLILYQSFFFIIGKRVRFDTGSDACHSFTVKPDPPFDIAKYLTHCHTGGLWVIILSAQ